MRTNTAEMETKGTKYFGEHESGESARIDRAHGWQMGVDLVLCCDLEVVVVKVRNDLEGDI